MERPIINIADLEYRPWGHGVDLPGAQNAGEQYQAKLGAIASKIGGNKLGYSLTILPAGKKAFPFHNHRVNEEMFFVVEGEGEFRYGKKRYPIKRGDVIACPPGGPETAHQIINNSKNDLKYLGVSTRLSPEIAEYPDSEKFGILAEYGPNPYGKQQHFSYVGRGKKSLNYWDGEWRKQPKNRRISCMLPSSWTAMAAGLPAAGCRVRWDINPALRPCDVRLRLRVSCRLAI